MKKNAIGSCHNIEARMNNKLNSKPELVIIEEFNLSDSQSEEKKTLEIIKANITDSSKLREFDCLFECTTKGSAKDLYQRLQKDHGYHAEKPYFAEDIWIIHAIKIIFHSDLEDTLRAAKAIAVKHSSELVDWNFDIDKDPRKK